MSIYTEKDLTDLRAQKQKRWILLALPGLMLLVLIVYSLTIRLEWLTSAATFVLGVLLIAGYDFAIKPLRCYEKHLVNCLHGRTRECELPFVSLSENVDIVDGVRFRQLLCSDLDGKGRPYERLFYFDAEKELPVVQVGDVLHIKHHDLTVADVHLA